MEFKKPISFQEFREDQKTLKILKNKWISILEDIKSHYNFIENNITNHFNNQITLNNMEPIEFKEQNINHCRHINHQKQLVRLFLVGNYPSLKDYNLKSRKLL
jgi:hypothetical protein